MATGHIRTRPTKDGRDGKPQAIFQRDHPGKPGKRITATKTFNTKREARDWLADQRVKYNREPNARPDRAKTKFPALVEKWQLVKWSTLEPRSRARYEQIVREHLMPEFKDAKVGDITREWVRDFLTALQSTQRPDGTPKYAPGTIHKVQTTLSAIMTEAVERNMVTANPCHGLNRRGKLLKPERKRDLDIPTAEQIHALADAAGAKHAPYRTLILTATFTGLRAGELHALRRRDVDLDGRRLTVAGALKVWRGGEPVFGMTKTNEVRPVLLSDEIRDLLAALLSPGGKPDDLVFTSMNGGGAIHQVAFLRNHFKPARKRALPDHADLRFHDLRHVYASMLNYEGIDSFTIAEQLGHSTMTTMTSRYTHEMRDSGEKVRAAPSRAYSRESESESNVFELHQTGAA
jgi:integrase